MSSLELCVESHDSDSSSCEDITEHQPNKMSVPSAQIDSCTDVQMGHRLHYHAPVVINQNFVSSTNQTISESVQQAVTAQILNNGDISEQEENNTLKKTLWHKFTVSDVLTKNKCKYITIVAVFLCNIIVTTTISLIIISLKEYTEIINPVQEVESNSSKWKNFKLTLDTLQKYRNKSFDWSLLPEVVKYGDEKLVKLLLDNGINPDMVDSRGLTGLHITAKTSNLKITDLLLSYGANMTIPAAKNFGEYPIHIAIEYKNRVIMIKFLDRGVPVDVRTAIHDTPLHYAAMFNDTTTAGILLQRGAYLNPININNETPIYFCSFFQYLQLAAFLIRKGADVNIKNNEMNTPLHMATNNGDLNMTCLLLQNGANISALNYKQESPLTLARSPVKEWLSSLLSNTEVDFRTLDCNK